MNNLRIIHPVQAALKTRVTLCMAFMVSSLPCWGQTSPSRGENNSNEDEKVIELSPFVVNEPESGYLSRKTMIGTRTAQDIVDISANVVVLNREFLDTISADRALEALQYGVSGVTTNALYTDDFSIRGFRTGLKRNGIDLDDGVESYQPMAYDVERLEVIKGPSALVAGFGPGSIGGFVNAVTFQPTAERRGQIKATLGENNYARVAANVSGPIWKSADVSANYRLTVGGLYADTDKELNRYEELYLGGGVTLEFGAATQVTFTGSYFDNPSYVYWADFLDTETELAFPGAPGGKGNLRIGKINKYSTKSFSPARSRDTYDDVKTRSADVTFLTNLTENAHIRATYVYREATELYAISRGIGVVDNFILNRQELIGDNAVVKHIYQADFTHHWPLEWVTIDTTLGVDGLLSDSNRRRAINTPPPLDTRVEGFPDDDAFYSSTRPGAGLPLPQHFNFRNRNFSGYIYEQLGFWDDRILLTGGFRWLSLTSESRIAPATTVTSNPSNDFSVHRYGLVVKIAPSISMYFVDGQNSYTNPFAILDKVVPGDQLGGQAKDSLGINTEFGLKIDHKFPNGIDLFATLAYYDMARTNVIVNGPLESGQFGNVQIGRVNSEGVEADVGMQINFGSGYADVLATYARGESGVANDPTLEADGYAPEKYSFIGSYTWNSGALSGLTIGGGVQDQSRLRRGNFMVDYPLTAMLFGRYNFRRHWLAQVNLQNITDKRYIAAIATPGLIQASAGSSYHVTVSYKW